MASLDWRRAYQLTPRDGARGLPRQTSAARKRKNRKIFVCAPTVKKNLS
jgi:hypothetical protein